MTSACKHGIPVQLCHSSQGLWMLSSGGSHVNIYGILCLVTHACVAWEQKQFPPQARPTGWRVIANSVPLPAHPLSPFMSKTLPTYTHMHTDVHTHNTQTRAHKRKVTPTHHTHAKQDVRPASTRWIALGDSAVGCMSSGHPLTHSPFLPLPHHT